MSICSLPVSQLPPVAEGVFAPAMIDGIIAELKSFNDRTLRAHIGNDRKKILALVESCFHCG